LTIGCLRGRSIIGALPVRFELFLVFVQILGMPVVVGLVEWRAVPRQSGVLFLERVGSALEPLVFFAFRFSHAGTSCGHYVAWREPFDTFLGRH
jgi:hypothetical protein